MTFAHLANPKPRTATEAYDQWLNGLPEDERGYVLIALRSTMSTPELKRALEADPDNPAPRYGKDVFRAWRRAVTA
ncbi:hypothetical protein [Microbacterium sp. KNMS]